MRAAFIPALPPSALMGGMIAPSFRLVNRFPEKSWFARAAAVRAAARAVRIICLVAARSLWHGPPLRRTTAARAFRAPIWRKKRGSRHPAAVPAGPRSCAPPGRSPAARARSRRGRRVPAPTARAMGAFCPGPAARQRFERPSGARNAACRTRRRISPGHAPATAAGRSAARARSRRGRRVPAPTARAVGAHLPRSRRTPAFRAPGGRKKRGMFHRPARYAGPTARTSRQRFGGPQPSK